MSKIKTEIKNTPPYEIITYNPDIDKLPELKKIIDSAYQKNLNFFNQKVEGIKVNFVYSNKELKKAAKEIGMKYQDWHKNYACKETIWLSSPHTPKGKEFPKSTIHEFAHVFTNKLFGYSNPDWLREGIANVVSEQYYPFKSNIPFKKAHSGQDFQEHPIYDKSVVFTRHLIDQFGKNKLFTLLKLIKKKNNGNNTYEDFIKIFDKVYGLNFEKIEKEFMKQRIV